MHLTDDQLNEYLDNESSERVQIEAHLSTCDECAARLTALKTLFAEIESLPELELTHSLTARFTPTPSLPVGQLPTWLTLTATLQAVLALIAVIFAAPFVTKLLPVVQMPSPTDIFLQLQSQWIAWLDALSVFQLPTLPQIPTLEISSLVLALTLAGVSMLWLVGNGLLLRNQTK
jgi:anti-sigma factor RsiW